MISISKTQQAIFSEGINAVVLIDHLSFFFNSGHRRWRVAIFAKNDDRFVSFCNELIQMPPSGIQLNGQLRNEIPIAEYLAAKSLQIGSLVIVD